MTIDGFCDHTAGFSADDELHDHYTELLNSAGIVLYGRTTYQLMQFWQTLLETPSEERSMQDFAVSIDRIEKLVFSNTLKETGWNTAKVTDRALDEAVRQLKQQEGKDILIGSRSLIIQLLNNNLVDELQVCIHPVVAGKGLPLFDQINDETFFKLIKTKTLHSGATVLYYKPTLEKTSNR